VIKYRIMEREKGRGIRNLVESIISPYTDVLPLLAADRLQGLEDDEREELLKERSAILVAMQTLGHEPQVHLGEAREPISTTMYKLSLLGDDNPLFQYAQAVATDEEFEEFMKLVKKKKKK
jgi:ribosome assembly protein YihI (activator of Der GTPase)